MATRMFDEDVPTTAKKQALLSMEVAHSAPETFQDNYRKKTPLPLVQLVEETRKKNDVPHHLLETKIYAKLKSNNVIQAEPEVLHFSGFELGKDYCKVLKLINISTEVINIHILPTQTKYFQTKYSKKHRLVPGLCYTLKVQFCPDEWRYFYDCIRVHCKEEDNLLVPVHAYPIIDDLHIPSHVNLPAVPLGERVTHVVPLSCSCPIDFEFQVFVLQPHTAFAVEPLTGVIPANGRVDLSVTFTPFQYGTSQVTLQVVISQFNSKPYVCTFCGTSSPHLALSHRDQERDEGPPGDSGRPTRSFLIRPRTRTKHRLMKPKVTREQRENPQESKVDVLCPAGVARMLLQQTDKLSAKDLRDAMSQSTLVRQTRQMKAALFENKVRLDIQEERANHLRWQVHLGRDPVSSKTRIQTLEERELSQYEYMVSEGELRSEGGASRGRPKLLARRVLRIAGQAPATLPTFGIYFNSQLEIRVRALRLFQQAARKVVIQCRMNHRLVPLRKLVDRKKKRTETGRVEKEEKTPLNISPDRVHPFTFPIFSPLNEEDELAPNSLGVVPVKPVDVFNQRHSPFFNLTVPQHYKLVGYHPLAVYEAVTNHIPPCAPRTLRTGAQDELLPMLSCPQPEGDVSAPGLGQDTPSLSFTAPATLLEPPYAHPLRIFNPAPGLHAFKAPPLYLESELEFHLCPLPRYTVQKGSVAGIHNPNTQKKFLDRTDVIRGVMTWKKFPSAALATLSSYPTLTSNWAPRLSDPFSADLLPMETPPVLDGLPEDLRMELLEAPCESAEVSLTPEMVRAEFPITEVSRPAREEGGREDSSSLSPCKTPQMMPLTTGTIPRETRGHQLEMSVRSQNNRLGSRVTARLYHLGITSLSSTQDNK